MIKQFEDGHINLKNLITWCKENNANLNEAETRFHIIDELFLNCLHWSKDDISVEENYQGEYADYVFSSTRKIMVVEAKRTEKKFEIPAGKNNLEYSIDTIIKNNSELEKAIAQVGNYCQKRGVPVGVVSNGLQLVAYIAVRTDGIPPVEGRCLVFPTLDFIEEKFLDFWNCLSKPGLLENNIHKRLLGSRIYQTPPRLSSSIYGYPGLKKRNVFQTDLGIVTEMVLEDIPNSNKYQKLFLSECYCKSGALSQYSQLSKTILQTRYTAIFDSTQPGPTITPAVEKEGISSELLAISMSRRPILILGDVGVGKTTFIKHLHFVDAANLVENAIVVYIDLGSQATFKTDVYHFVISEFSNQLQNNYEIDIDDRQFVRGVYNLEIERFHKGIYSDLLQFSPEKFMEKEIEFLENKVNDREEHIRKSIYHIVRGRKKQVVIFIDNADQREFSVQQSAFLISQELAEHTPASVFVALRPETFHKSMKEGVLSGYHPKAFTISPPRVDDVISKRLIFALKITSGEVEIEQGINIQLENLDAIIKIFLDSIQRNNDLVEFIDNICGGNIRLALDLLKSFFGSGHADTEKMVNIYNDSGSYYIPIHEFIRAVIYGDSEHYDSSRSRIANIFDVSSSDEKEHFLLPIILGFLAKQASESREGFVDTEHVFQHAQGFGFIPEQIDKALQRAENHKLIHFSARGNSNDDPMPLKMRISSNGAYQVNTLCKFFVYLDAIIVDLPIFNKEIRADVKNVFYIKDRLNRAQLVLEYLDDQWAKLDDRDSYFNWSMVRKEISNDINIIRNRITE